MKLNIVPNFKVSSTVWSKFYENQAQKSKLQVYSFIFEASLTITMANPKLKKKVKTEIQTSWLNVNDKNAVFSNEREGKSLHDSLRAYQNSTQ